MNQLFDKEILGGSYAPGFNPGRQSVYCDKSTNKAVNPDHTNLVIPKPTLIISRDNVVVSTKVEGEHQVLSTKYPNYNITINK